MNNLDTNESIYGFFQQQENQSKAKINIATLFLLMAVKIILNDLFMKGNEDQKYDVLTNENSKHLFCWFNDYLEYIFEPIKPVRDSVITDDGLALEVIQNKNWQYFIETIWAACKTKNGGVNNTVDLKNINLMKSSIENITICKQTYLNFYNQILQYLENKINIYQQMKEMKLIYKIICEMYLILESYMI